MDLSYLFQPPEQENNKLEEFNLLCLNVQISLIIELYMRTGEVST